MPHSGFGRFALARSKRPKFRSSGERPFHRSFQSLKTSLFIQSNSQSCFLRMNLPAKNASDRANMDFAPPPTAAVKLPNEIVRWQPSRSPLQLRNFTVRRKLNRDTEQLRTRNESPVIRRAWTRTASTGFNEKIAWHHRKSGHAGARNREANRGNFSFVLRQTPLETGLPFFKITAQETASGHLVGG